MQKRYKTFSCNLQRQPKHRVINSIIPNTDIILDKLYQNEHYEDTNLRVRVARTRQK